MRKLVLRVLDEAGQMLGWEQTEAHAPGDGTLTLLSPVNIPIDRHGTPAVLSVHWVDPNVEIQIPVTVKGPVSVGTLFPVRAGAIVRVGPQAAGLPPVTLRSTAQVVVPVGALGSLTTRVSL